MPWDDEGFWYADDPPPFESGYPEPEPTPPPVTGIPTGPGADNPFTPPGNDAGTPGPGGDAPGSGGAGSQFDWGKFAAQGPAYLKTLLGASATGNIATDLAKVLGLTKPDGSIDAGGLLSLLALFGGGALTHSASSDAVHQIQDAANKASDEARTQIGTGGPTGGGARQNYQPFIAAGTKAIDTWSNQAPSNLAASFASKGTPSDLASKFKATGMFNLAQLAKR